jgi:hypothetical protein
MRIHQQQYCQLVTNIAFMTQLSKIIFGKVFTVINFTLINHTRNKIVSCFRFGKCINLSLSKFTDGFDEGGGGYVRAVQKTPCCLRGGEGRDKFGGRAYTGNGVAAVVQVR